MLYDWEENQTILAKLGQSFERYGIDIIRFEEQDPKGEVVDYPRLTIFDGKNNREFVLTSAPKYWDDLWDIQVRSKEDQSITILSRQGEDFTVGGEHYTLERVNLEEKLLQFSQKVGRDSCTFSLHIPDDARK
jgi:hypothetical protein